MSKQNFGGELRENNEKIVECILLLRDQRSELGFIIEKQYEERKNLEKEMERLTFKLCLLNKSLAQRILAKKNYDETIAEVEARYKKLIENSSDLLEYLKSEFQELESMLSKKTGTEDNKDDDDDKSKGDSKIQLNKRSNNGMKPNTKDQASQETMISSVRLDTNGSETPIKLNSKS